MIKFKKFYFLTFILIIMFTANAQYSQDLKIIILSTSKFWFNYRQGTNNLMINWQLKENGITDDNILMSIPENNACNARNNEPGVVSCYDGSNQPNLYLIGETDYKHSDVNVEQFLNILRGRYKEFTPQSKKLKLQENTKLLVYINGHGGNTYVKMQDTHVMSSYDYAKVIKELYIKKQFQEMLTMSDSCEAVTVFNELENLNIFAIGSSVAGEKSFSHGKDDHIQLSKSDKFSFRLTEFLKDKFSKNRSLTLSDLIKVFDKDFLGGEIETRNHLIKKTEQEILVRDYFSNLQKPQIEYFDFQQEFAKLQENTESEDIKYIQDFASFISTKENTKNNQKKKQAENFNTLHYKPYSLSDLIFADTIISSIN